MNAPFLPAGFLQNIGLFELLCVGFVILVTLIVVGGVTALIAIRSRRRPCPHCGVSQAMRARFCSSCGKQIE